MRFHSAIISLAAVLTATNGFAQREQINLDLIGDFVVVAAEENDEGKVDGSREVTVEVKRDGKMITVTQTVKGEFIGEIVEGDETTEIRAKSLDELKEKSPEGHAAFHEKPAAVKPADAQAASVSVSDNNGARKIEILEAGRKVIVRDQRGKQFGITVKQNLEHGIRVERVDAADMNALKKIAPELAKLVEQYAGRANAAADIRVQAIQRVGRLNGNAIPAGPRKISGEYDSGKVVIRDENGKDIRMSIWKTVDGKEEVTEIKADDFADLKKKFPELAEVYEKLAGKGGVAANQFQNGNIIIGNAGAGIRLQAQAVPIQAVPEVERAAPPARDLAQLKQVMEIARKKVERLANDPKFVDQDAAKELTEDIDDILEKLQELQDKVKP
jgi:hypothetical protein